MSSLHEQDGHADPSRTDDVRCAAVSARKFHYFLRTHSARLRRRGGLIIYLPLSA